MNDTLQLKREIVAILDLLPLEGLKLLSEFVAFLRIKFKLPQPVTVQTETLDWQQRMETFMQKVSAQHPLAKMSREEILAHLHQTREDVCNELHGEVYAD